MWISNDAKLNKGRPVPPKKRTETFDINHPIQVGFLD